MIKFPENWKEVGQPSDIYKIEKKLMEVVDQLGCVNLALSGGVDSSYMCYIMKQVFGQRVNCYTIALNEIHPDYIYSAKIVSSLRVNWRYYLTEVVLADKEGDYPGDSIVRTFFEWIYKEKISEIVCGDGIDEFMGGYYAHSNHPVHEVYYEYMLKLQREQLIPLDYNSRDVEVYLPYIAPDLLALYNSIPMADRFDYLERKKIMIKLAEGKIPDEIIYRRKYGFVDAMIIKGGLK